MAFLCRKHLAVRASSDNPLPGIRLTGGDDAVRVVWIMVKERQPLHVGRQRKVNQVVQVAMPPSDLRSILLGRILRVHDQEVGASGEVREPPVFGMRKTPRLKRKASVACRNEERQMRAMLV